MPSYGFLASFGARRFPKGERKAIWYARRRILLPRWGLTRRLRREGRACSPMGRSHFSFDGERKVCKRKPAARHYGKKPFIAHFDGGARNVARNFVGELPPTFARAPVLPFFRRQNGRAFFPSLPNAALLPRSWHRADSNSGAWELQRSLAASQRRETDLIFFLYSWRKACLISASWDAAICHKYFTTQKASMVSNPCWPLLRAMRPVAE